MSQAPPCDFAYYNQLHWAHNLAHMYSTCLLPWMPVATDFVHLSLTPAMMAALPCSTSQSTNHQPVCNLPGTVATKQIPKTVQRAKGESVDITYVDSKGPKPKPSPSIALFNLENAPNP